MCNLVEGSVSGSRTLTAAQATALNGTSIGQVLADANNALGGNGWRFTSAHTAIWTLSRIS